MTPGDDAGRHAVRILPGARGADKVHWSEGLSPSSAATSPRQPPPPSLVLFFGGDRLEDPTAHPDVHRLQSPSEVARLCRRRFGPGATIVQVVANRHEAGFACYDHFLGATTRSGEPLGYATRVPASSGDGSVDPGALAAGLPALAQAASLVVAGGWPPPPGGAAQATWPPTTLVAFSKGGVVANQALAELAALAAAAGDGGAAPAWSEGALAASVAALAASITSLLYVDVGLNGRGAYACPPDAPRLGTRTAPPPPTVTLYGTLRQWPRGGPQAAERDRMVAGLEAAGVSVSVVECGLAERKVSLAMHFRCLEEALGDGGGGAAT